MSPQDFATAYAFSTSIGLRAFMTLAIASLAMHFGYIHPAPQFAWLGSDGATTVLAVLAVLEFASDKVPALDHVMHGFAFAVKPIAAALLVGSIVPDGNQSLEYATVGLAALNALGIHTASAGLRAVSTTTTLGVANPIVSFVEDFLSIGGALLALVAPFVGAAIALVVTVLLIVAVRRAYELLRSRRARTAT